MERSATAVWNGGLKDGKGSISTPSGVLSDSPYSFLTRFENAKGTNPGRINRRGPRGLFRYGTLGPTRHHEFHTREDSRHR